MNYIDQVILLSYIEYIIIFTIKLAKEIVLAGTVFIKLLIQLQNEQCEKGDKSLKNLDSE